MADKMSQQAPVRANNVNQNNLRATRTLIKNKIESNKGPNRINLSNKGSKTNKSSKGSSIKEQQGL